MTLHHEMFDRLAAHGVPLPNPIVIDGWSETVTFDARVATHTMEVSVTDDAPDDDQAEPKNDVPKEPPASEDDASTSPEDPE